MLPFLKLNPKSQTTMDDDIDILVFFMAISQVKKNIETLHHSQTSTKAQQKRTRK
jgi:hypothetical protein